MEPSASHDIDRIAGILSDHGYEIRPTWTEAAVLATRRGHSWGPFLPVTDFIFLRNCSAETSSATFEEFHERARAYAESQFPLPRPMRYHIPNTVSVGVSEDGFSAETIAFARASKQRSHLAGGEKNSTYLFDIAAKELYSQGVERTPVRYGGTIVSGVNPTNRVYYLMSELAEKLFKG